MIALTPRQIKLHAHAKTKEEAIREVGQLLVESGCIAPGYVESMLGRESQANTFLSHGIAIPHGMLNDRELIHKTGIAVVQVPAGVSWGTDQTAHLIVGIAARSDEHLAILAALTDVLDDENASHRLAVTDDPNVIIAALTRQELPTGGRTQALQDAQEIEVKIIGKAGLHARPATCFVDIASKFSSDIRVIFGEKVGNGKAMASLLKLGVPGDGSIRIQAAGSDAKDALQALGEAVKSGLNDTEEHAEPARKIAAAIWSPHSEGRALIGVSASPGLAIGQIHIFQSTTFKFRPDAENAAVEKESLNAALENAHQQLDAIYEDVSVRSGQSNASIFRAHQALLQDSELLDEVNIRVESGRSAAWSWQESIATRVAEMRNLGNELFAARATDLHDVGQRVLRILAGADYAETSLPDEPVILIADDLTPSDTAKLDPRRVLGICTALGGPTSHTAIIARSLDIPAVVGAGPAVLEQLAGSTCILDGTGGRLYIEPSPKDLESASHFQDDLHLQRDAEMETRYQPAILTDGHRVEVVANIGKPEEAAAAVEAGAEGIGLLRTEFLFLGRETAPTEDEQFEAYSTMIKALNGLPLMIRTLDIGGDKTLPYLPLPHEDNPFLGVRGIRLCLRRPELFLPQLRAIYRASALGPVQIMFPMITTLEDFREAKQIAENVRQELGVKRVPIGIMVEVPSTVMMAPEFAKEVDFFSVGTNDLTQYALAMDRLHPALAKHVDGLHPAVLRMIDQTVRAASAAGKWVGVCGGVAGDPLGSLILTGLGVTELSMALPSVAAVKALLRETSLSATQELAKKALACSSSEEVRQLTFA